MFRVISNMLLSGCYYVNCDLYGVLEGCWLLGCFGWLLGCSGWMLGGCLGVFDGCYGFHEGC